MLYLEYKYSCSLVLIVYINSKQYFITYIFYYRIFIQDYLLRKFDKKLYRNYKRYIVSNMENIIKFLRNSILC